MSTYKTFFAGAGGQGVILMGQILTHAAMLENKNATFFPSYGPEMRGGSANCTVVVSDKEVSCPVIYAADIAVIMNLPSLIKFESIVRPGGKLLLNTSLIDQKVKRTDIEVLEIPATDMAAELGNPRVANIIMMGALTRSMNIVSEESIKEVIHEFGIKKPKLIDINLKAFDLFEPQPA